MTTRRIEAMLQEVMALERYKRQIQEVARDKAAELNFLETEAAYVSTLLFDKRNWITRHQKPKPPAKWGRGASKG